MEKVNPVKQAGVAIVLIALSVAGAIIGVQLITTIGVTPNTSIIGALFAMLLARIPYRRFAAIVRLKFKTSRKPLFPPPPSAPLIAY